MFLLDKTIHYSNMVLWFYVFVNYDRVYTYWKPYNIRDFVYDAKNFAVKHWENRIKNFQNVIY